MLKEYIRTALGCAKRIPLLLSQLSKRDPNLYMFGAWLGQKFSDNSRALFLYTLHHTDKRCFWICKNKELYCSMKAQGLPVYMAYSPKGIYYQLKAAVAFTCTGDCDFARETLGGCVHVELWHGVGGCKKVGMDDPEYRDNALSFHGRAYRKMEEKPMGKFYFLTTSPANQGTLVTAFLLKDEQFIHAGQPRNDMFYDEGYVPATISKEEFGGKKVILYMPTHRKGGQVHMDMSKLLDLPALEEFCQKNNAVLLIKKHFYHSHEQENLESYPHILDITNRPVDANEILLASDYMISDYSSCVGDYLLLNRPVFFYCYDFENYVSMDRELYYPYDSITPGDHCHSFPELLASLKRTIEQGEDPYAQERRDVRDMYYAPHAQKPACPVILEQVEKILQK